jgi:hypothetical protein
VDLPNKQNYHKLTEYVPEFDNKRNSGSTVRNEVRVEVKLGLGLA